MIKGIYSYRLKKVVTLLSSEEFSPIRHALDDRMEQIKKYRQSQDSSIEEARRNTSTDALDLYENLTGIRLQHPEELFAVLQDLYGSLCPGCSKPFRTPRATFCAECGYELPKDTVAGPLRD